MVRAQGKHREFCLDPSMATLKILVTSSGTFYSQSLRFNAPLGTQCTQLEEGIVGSRSTGLPLNIVISGEF